MNNYPLSPSFRVHQNTIKLVYSGSISGSYDLSTLVRFIVLFNQKFHLRSQLFVAGSGSPPISQKKDLLDDSVVFLGQLSILVVQSL